MGIWDHRKYRADFDANSGKNMGDIDINTLTMEQYIALIRHNNRSGVVKPEIRNNVNFKIKSHFMKKLRRNLFAGTEDEDAHEHVFISIMTPAQALKSIEVMVDHSHNWNDGATTRQGSNDSSDDIDMQKLNENIHDIQEIVNQFCEESIKEQAAIDEWIRKYKENTDLNLMKLDALTKNLEAREVKKEPVPRDLPIVNPYVPPIPFPGRWKEQEDDPYITRESIYMIRFSKRINEEEFELLIAEDTQSSLTKM
ncbi:hypothetical protein Tco_0316944 [Tanacetum coccineum]